MGETALAFKDLPHGKRCWAVIKRPLAGLADDVEFRKRFLHEALVATMVQHRSVVHLEASGEDLDGPYLVLEYVHGLTLSDFVDRLCLFGRRASALALSEILHAGASGLAALHSARDGSGEWLGIVHQDVSLSNILLSQAGEAKLGDFGICRSRKLSVSTDESRVLGQLPFLAPEYLLHHRASPKMDVYALGLSVWATAAGGLPYPTSRRERSLDLLEHGIPELGSVRSDLPAELCELIGAMCARDPNQRPDADIARQLASRWQRSLSQQASLAAEIDSCAGHDLRARRSVLSKLADEWGVTHGNR